MSELGVPRTKADILSEIQRTAASNGGQPLGKDRFFAETGLRESDWLGRYWIRWSDALTDAGFAPNHLNQRLPDDVLLEKLATLVSEIGRFPVSAELRMRARSDPTFPSHNTFRRFGDKQAIVARLRAFCLERGQEAVATICSLGTTDSERIEYPVGFVYLMKSGSFYKIGRTNALGRRERELAIQLPEKLNVVHSIRTDDPVGIEEYWHKRFSQRRRNGEWFELTPQDVVAFRRRRFM